jgi:ABC-type multidrug transport system fused ATPase/permease subunit
MVHGQLAETGAHEELLELEGVYADLYQTQARPYQ